MSSKLKAFARNASPKKNYDRYESSNPVMHMGELFLFEKHGLEKVL